jgi:hypothetical protein
MAVDWSCVYVIINGLGTYLTSFNFQLSSSFFFSLHYLKRQIKMPYSEENCFCQSTFCSDKHPNIVPSAITHQNNGYFVLSLLGNSGKPVTLVALSLTKFLRHVFQGQETHDFRKPGTCEAPNSWMYEVRESWFGEVIGSRTCGGPEPQAGGGANFRGRPVRESVEDSVREFHVKTFTNRRRSKVKVVVPKSPGLECELVANL